jgi:hypothetical protein
METNAFSGKTAQEQEEIEISAEYLAQLFNYPSIGQLFDDASLQRLDDFRARLSGTRENLERVVRYGSRDEAGKAEKAVRSIQITLEFLDTLKKMRLSQK